MKAFDAINKIEQALARRKYVEVFKGAEELAAWITEGGELPRASFALALTALQTHEGFTPIGQSTLERSVMLSGAISALELALHSRGEWEACHNEMDWPGEEYKALMLQQAQLAHDLARVVP